MNSIDVVYKSSLRCPQIKSVEHCNPENQPIVRYSVGVEGLTNLGGGRLEWDGNCQNVEVFVKPFS